MKDGPGGRRPGPSRAARSRTAALGRSDSEGYPVPNPKHSRYGFDPGSSPAASDWDDTPQQEKPVCVAA
ncbi:hypothetical protein N5A92_13610 [Chelativorans sp. EGI FJ00035]|uniref:Uncharacterized protein n=1 Tax=Chelativorans salis TaxID=2978478 RepID=A0ABT2LSB7_9HYPH|nr:hypothetical protein [Chelativorans sp. EGI FJ00035]